MIHLSIYLNHIEFLTENNSYIYIYVISYIYIYIYIYYTKDIKPRIHLNHNIYKYIKHFYNYDHSFNH